MTLKKLFQILIKEKNLILSLVVLTIFFVLIFNVTTKPKYEISFSLLISQTQTQKTNEFKYDTYYALEAKDKIGDYVIGLLKSPEQVGKILKSSDLELANYNPHDLRTFFRSFKASSQSIGVIFYLDNPKQAETIVKNTVSSLNQELEKVYTPSSQDTTFAIKTTNPLIALKKSNLVLNLIVSLIASLIIATLIALFKNYLKE